MKRALAANTLLPSSVPTASFGALLALAVRLTFSWCSQFLDCDSFATVQDLADLVRADGVGGGGGGGATVDLRGANGSGGEADHVAAARGMTLALAALQGLLQHLELLEDSSNHGTFSLTLGNFSQRRPIPFLTQASGVFVSKSNWPSSIRLSETAGC